MKKTLALALFLVGCTGADGSDGANGANGMDGADGMNGADGMDGEDGQDGTNGGMGVVRTIVVSPAATEVASGTALAAAIQDFVTNATKASATNRWLIKIEPGIYDVGATGLNTVPFVDIEGSGEGTTTIKGTGDTLTTDADVEIRNLSVRCDGGSCIAVQNSASPTFTNVTITAAGLTSLSWAFGSTAGNPYLRDVTVVATGVDANALWLEDGVPFLRNVDAYASGSGTDGPAALNVFDAGPTIADSTFTAIANPATAPSTGLYYGRTAGAVTTDFDDVTIVATGNNSVGVFAFSSVVAGVEIFFQDSTIKGTTQGITLANDESVTLFTANTMIGGGFSVGTDDQNTLVCLGAYNEDYYSLFDGDAYTSQTNGACTTGT